VQGSAADLVKLAMVATTKRLAADGFDVKLILQVHDELVFEAPEREAAAAAHVIRGAMADAMAPFVDLRVPLAVDIGIGANWLEAHFR
jgi:DNA polymerase-1